MDSVRWIISTAPEIFLLLSVAIGTMFVPFVAPKLMRIDLKKEAAKLAAELSGGIPLKTENLAYRKFQARAYRVSAGAGRTVKAIEDEVGSRTVIERIVRKGADIPPQLDTVLEDGDDIVIAGPTAAVGLVCGWLRSRRPTIGAMPPAAQQTLSDLGLGGFIAAVGLANGHAARIAIQAHGLLLVGMGLVVTLVPLIVATLFAHHALRMNPVITCGALAGAMTVDAAVTGCCDMAESQTPVLGVAVPYAVGNVVLTVLGPIIVACTFVG
jgi:AspT/YidE/YbjL antiporter-like protein